jgi:chromatin segregation and condensation protein Rec8/ScpA/Scc1 (kleisin family)
VRPRRIGVAQKPLEVRLAAVVARVLLRDAVRTLMKATLLIRRAGLCKRMQAPEEFLRRMNRMSIEMTQQGRRAGRKKERKRVLRQMKKLVGVVRNHARRHRELLDKDWAQTEWTRAQAEQILRRMDGILELLPRAQKQAHERIIGGRPVPNAEKILSQQRHLQLLTVVLLAVLRMLAYAAAFDLDHWAEWIVFGGICLTALGAIVAVHSS